jgi:hypothetical protein
MSMFRKPTERKSLPMLEDAFVRRAVAREIQSTKRRSESRFVTTPQYEDMSFAHACHQLGFPGEYGPQNTFYVHLTHDFFPGHGKLNGRQSSMTFGQQVREKYPAHVLKTGKYHDDFDAIITREAGCFRELLRRWTRRFIIQEWESNWEYLVDSLHCVVDSPWETLGWQRTDPYLHVTFEDIFELFSRKEYKESSPIKNASLTLLQEMMSWTWAITANSTHDRHAVDGPMGAANCFVVTYESGTNKKTNGGGCDIRDSGFGKSILSDCRYALYRGKFRDVIKKRRKAMTNYYRNGLPREMDDIIANMDNVLRAHKQHCFLISRYTKKEEPGFVFPDVVRRAIISLLDAKCENMPTEKEWLSPDSYHSSMHHRQITVRTFNVDCCFQFDLPPNLFPFCFQEISTGGKRRGNGWSSFSQLFTVCWSCFSCLCFSSKQLQKRCWLYNHHINIGSIK